MSIAETKCVNADLVARLRHLADVLEREDVPALGGYAALTSDWHVLISESAFRKLFAGQSVRGRKDGCIINASAKSFGISFGAMIYDSDDGRVRDVLIQL